MNLWNASVALRHTAAVATARLPSVTDTKMTYTRTQLISALQHEYEYLIHDDFDAEHDMTAEQHLEWLRTLPVEELATLTETDDIYTIDEFMHNHG